MTFQLEGDASQIYEQVLVPLWFGRWAEALVDVLSLKPAESVLDIACGTGVTTRLASSKVGPDGRVDGLDNNASMLAQARSIGAGENTRWIAGDAGNTGLPADSYDVVLSQHGYHYFPDKPRALREFRRVLVGGGRMAFSVWDGHSPYTLALCAAVGRYISPDVASKQRAQRETPTSDLLAEQVRAAGFSDIHVERQELEIEVPLAREFVPLHLGSMPIAAAFQSLSEDRRQRLVDDVQTALNEYVRGDRVVYPDAVHVAVGVNGAV